MISVIVPIYGVERFLHKCVESIMTQSYADLEIILVDDGSPDNCPDICDDFAKKDSRVRVIHQKNNGLVNARKTGILAASGEFVAYVDGDDWLEPDALSVMIKNACKTKADVVAAGFIKDIGNRSYKRTNPIFAGEYANESLHRDIFSRMVFDEDASLPGIYTYLWNKLFRREFLLTHQLNVPDDITLGEDAACLYPALLKAKKITVVSDCLYHYRQWSDSMLKKSSDAHRIKRLYEYLRECFGKESCKSSLMRQLSLYTAVMTASLLSGWELSLYGENLGQKSLAIYGAGTFGQHLYAGLRENRDIEIVKWVDYDYEAYREHGLFVDEPKDLAKSNFDKLLVAMEGRQEKDAALRFVKSIGISEEKIVTTDIVKAVENGFLQKCGIV